MIDYSARRPDGTPRTTDDWIADAMRAAIGLKDRDGLTDNERSLIAVVQLLAEACGNMYDELLAVKQSIRYIGGIDPDDVHGTILSGMVSEQLDAIGDRSGFGIPGGFRRLVLDRLDAIENDHRARDGS